MGLKLQGRHVGSKFGVHLLVVIFGTTSWSIMNGLWVELPILVSHLPEEWTLPSYLTIICQFGNIGPLVFSLIAYLVPKTKLETPASFVIVAGLTVCSLLYAMFWKHTAHVAGDEHSVALLSLTLCQAVFAATTSVVYVTFMAHLKACYMASIFIGMGLSGLIPAFAALGQGFGSVRCVHNATTGYNVTNTAGVFNTSVETSSPGSNVTYTSDYTQQVAGDNDTLVALAEEPAFTVQSFFLMLSGTGLLSLVSLVLLVYHPYCKTEHVDTDKEENCRLMETHRENESNKHDNEATNADSSLKDFSSLKLSETRENKVKDRSASDRSTTDSSINATHTTDTDQSFGKSDTNSDVPHTILESISDQKPASMGDPKNNPNKDFKIEDKEVRTVRETNNDGDDSKKVTSYNNATNSKAKNDARNEDVAENEGHKQRRQQTKLQSWYMLGLLVWINALQTSFLLAIQVYSSLPYGIQYYHGATKAENIVDPLASFLTFLIAAQTVPVISGLTLLGTLFAAYIITVAAMSPEPFLVNEQAGGILAITAWILCTVVMIFTKVSIAKVMRGQGRLSLMWTGASTQLGAFLGAILAYVLVNVLGVFRDEPWCR